MKKILAMMCVAASVFAACTPEEDSATLPSVSFESAVPVAADGTATFKIVTANYTAAEAVTIPVTFSGKGVLDTDYTVSAEAFVVGGEAPVTEITVTAINYGTGADVTLTLGIPEGWTGGKYTTSTFTLADKLGAVSFSNNRAGMTNKVTLTVGVYDTKGNSLRLEKGDKIAVVVNTEESTAIEGTHFSFADGKEVSIAAGENSGTITLNMIGETPVEGADTLVLELDPGVKYDPGTNRKVTITILGAEWNRLNGEWKIEKMYTDRQHMETYWSTMLTGYEYLPEYHIYNENGEVTGMINENDKIVFDMEAMTLTPYFESAFKNYFIGVSNITPDEDIRMQFNGGYGAHYVPDWWFDPVYASTMWLDNTNRYFSATEQSIDDKVSMLAYGLRTDDEGNDIIHIYVIDYTTKSFFPEFFYHLFPPTDLGVDEEGNPIEPEDYSSWVNAEKPTVTTPDMFLIASFKKVVAE